MTKLFWRVCGKKRGTYRAEFQQDQLVSVERLRKKEKNEVANPVPANSTIFRRIAAGHRQFVEIKASA